MDDDVYLESTDMCAAIQNNRLCSTLDSIVQYNVDSPGILLKTTEISGDTTLILPTVGTPEGVKVTLNLRSIPNSKVDPVFTNTLPPFLSMNESGMNMIPLNKGNFKQGNNLRYSLSIKDPSQQNLGQGIVNQDWEMNLVFRKDGVAQ